MCCNRHVISSSDQSHAAIDTWSVVWPMARAATDTWSTELPQFVNDLVQAFAEIRHVFLEHGNKQNKKRKEKEKKNHCEQKRNAQQSVVSLVDCSACVVVSEWLIKHRHTTQQHQQHQRENERTDGKPKITAYLDVFIRPGFSIENGKNLKNIIAPSVKAVDNGTQANSNACANPQNKSVHWRVKSPIQVFQPLFWNGKKTEGGLGFARRSDQKGEVVQGEKILAYPSPRRLFHPFSSSCMPRIQDDC